MTTESDIAEVTDMLRYPNKWIREFVRAARKCPIHEKRELDQLMQQKLFKPFLTRQFVDPTEEITELRKERDYWLDMFKRRMDEIEKLRTRKTMVQVKKIKLGPKETLVVQAPGMITGDTVKRIVSYAKKCGIKMLVLADGLKVKKVIKKRK